MHDAPLPDLVLYGRPGCGLCDEARDDPRPRSSTSAQRAGLADPALVERDIETDPDWERAFFASIPVVELGDRRLELATSAAKLRRLAGRRPGRLTIAMSGTDLTILRRLRRRRHQLPVAMRPAARAGLRRPADRDRGRAARRRASSRRAGSRCATPSRTSPGFGAVFTLLGVTAHVRGRSARRLPAGAADDRRRHPDRPRPRPGRDPPHPGPRADLATARRRRRRHRSRPRPVRWRSGAGGATPSVGDRLGGHVVSSRGGWLASFGLGAIFAIGWTPVHRDHPRRDPDAGRDVRHDRPGRASCWSPTRSGWGCRSSSSPPSSTAHRA